MRYGLRYTGAFTSFRWSSLPVCALPTFTKNSPLASLKTMRPRTRTRFRLLDLEWTFGVGILPCMPGNSLPLVSFLSMYCFGSFKYLCRYVVVGLVTLSYLCHRGKLFPQRQWRFIDADLTFAWRKIIYRIRPTFHGSLYSGSVRPLVTSFQINFIWQHPSIWTCFRIWHCWAQSWNPKCEWTRVFSEWMSINIFRILTAKLLICRGYAYVVKTYHLSCHAARTAPRSPSGDRPCCHAA